MRLPFSKHALGAAIGAAFLTAAAFGTAGAEQLTQAQVQAAAAAAFPPGQVDLAVAVAWCESRFDAEARAPAGYQGLWQIDPWLHGWRAEALFGTGASLTDPQVNAAVAAQILSEQGWHAWPVCSGV